MRNLVLYMQQTLNGYGTDPADAMEWARVTPETWAFTSWIQQTCDAVVIGRKMYQDFLGFWPAAATDPADTDVARHARWFAGVRKYVVSGTLTEVSPAWPNTAILGHVGDIEPIKQQDGGNLVIFGGIDIANAFARAGLIDDYYLHVNPTTIPKGRLLLDGRLDLDLAEVRTHESGVLVLHYTRSATTETGS